MMRSDLRDTVTTTML